LKENNGHQIPAWIIWPDVGNCWLQPISSVFVVCAHAGIVNSNTITSMASLLNVSRYIEGVFVLIDYGALLIRRFW